MTQSRPKTKESGLLEQLEIFFGQDNAPSEFVLASIKRDAKQLMAVDASAGHIVLAGVAALLWDEAGVQRHCRQAITLERSPGVLMNAALNLRNVCYVHQAADLAQEAALLDPLNLSAQTDAIDSLVAAGRLTESMALLKDNLQRGVSLEGVDERGHLETIAALEVLGIEESQLKAELDVAYAVLREMRYRPRGFGFSVETSPDGDASVIYSVSILGDYTDEIRVERVLAERLAELDDWNPALMSIQLEGVDANADHSN